MGRDQQFGFADFWKKQQAARGYGTPFFAGSAFEKLDNQNAAIDKDNRRAFMPADDETSDANDKKKGPRGRGKKKPFTATPGKKDENGAGKRRDVVPVKDYVETGKVPGKRDLAEQQLAAALQRENDDRADSKSPPPDIENEDEEDENAVEVEVIETDDKTRDQDSEDEELPIQRRRRTRGTKAKENEAQFESGPTGPRRLTRGRKVQESEEEQLAIAASLEMVLQADPMDALFNDSAMPEKLATDSDTNEATDEPGGTDETDDTLFGTDDTPVDAWQPYSNNEKTAAVPTRFLGLARVPAEFVDEFKALFGEQFDIGEETRCQFTSESVNNSYPELEDIGIEFWSSVRDAEYAKWFMSGMFVAGKKLQVVFAIEE